MCSMDAGASGFPPTIIDIMFTCQGKRSPLTGAVLFYIGRGMRQSGVARYVIVVFACGGFTRFVPGEGQAEKESRTLIRL